jgi:hypothetical protein
MAWLEALIELEGVAVEVALEELVKRRALGMARAVDAARS